MDGACSNALGGGRDMKTILGLVGGTVPLRCGVIKGDIFLSSAG